ncbi:MAG: polyamine aminopropyltransferase [Clostridiaceae bacterium]|nr:polyamine aminopropyltransferase [Clostridiaceae bacterium]
MDLWFKETQIENATMTYKVKETLHTERTKYQELAILDTCEFGRMLVLDGIVQTTIRDEFVYHEMITHIPLFTHKNPKKVLVVGGGDGGTIREILKHESVEKAVLCEIDNRVVELSKEYLPEISCGLDDPRVKVFIGDGIKYVMEHKNEFDIIIVDSTDPVGAAEGLYNANFYKSLYNCLTPDGIFAAHTESPFYSPQAVKQIFGDIKNIFPITKLFMAAIPTYPSGYWSFTIGSKKYDPEKVDIHSIPDFDTKYYYKDLHKACFVLPKYVKKLIMTDSLEQSL